MVLPYHKTSDCHDKYNAEECNSELGVLESIDVRHDRSDDDVKQVGECKKSACNGCSDVY